MRKPSICPKDNITRVSSGQSTTYDEIKLKNAAHAKTKQFSVKDSTRNEHHYYYHKYRRFIKIKANNSLS